jgi:hypothetical protein
MYPRTGGETFTSISSSYLQVTRKCGADKIRAWDGRPRFMSRVPVHDGVDAVMDYLFLEEQSFYKRLRSMSLSRSQTLRHPCSSSSHKSLDDDIPSI